jgi:alkylation response protein AidB-like acyl-CoA dehydrogenase
MYFGMTEEQRSLQDTVRSILAGKFPLAAVRHDYDHGDGDPVALWQLAAEHGWLGVLVPEEHDGLGLGLLEAAAVVRALGASAAPGPYLPTLAAVEAVRIAGSTEQHRRWLPRVAAGEVRLSLAFRRDGAAWDASSVGPATVAGNLYGSATHVEYAQVADALVVAALDGHDIRLYLVDPGQPGVVVQPLESIDRTTRLATVIFDGAVGELLPASNRAVFGDILDRAAVLYANDLAGLAREGLSRTVAYDIERVQFGRPVGSFQAVKHALADLHVMVTMAEHATLYAAYALDEDFPDAPLAASIAKAKASDAAREVVAGMIQFHGGIGFTWESDVHIFFKRAKREEYQYGDATWHRERVTRIVVDRPSGAPGRLMSVRDRLVPVRDRLVPVRGRLLSDQASVLQSIDE